MRTQVARRLAAATVRSAWPLALALSACSLLFPAPENRNLFLDAKQPERSGPAGLSPDIERKHLRRVRYAELNEAYFSKVIQDTSGSVSLVINLFSDAAYDAATATLTAVSSQITNWKGVPKDPDVLRISFMIKDGSILGEVRTATTVYRITPTDRPGWHAISEVDVSTLPSEAEPLLSPSKRPSDPGPDANRVICDMPHEQPPGKTTPIDLLVVYTPAAKAGSSDISRDILLAIDQTAMAWATPNFHVTPKLAHMDEIPYVESGSFDTDLRRLTNPSDSYMAAVPALRNTHKADLVALIVESGDYCGIGWLNSPIAASDEQYAFTVTRRSCLTGLTLPHELGHNLGMRHDRYVDNGSGFNFGFVSTKLRLVTTMSYFNKCAAQNLSCQRVLSYSSPDLYYKSEALGVAIGKPDSAHNREVLCRSASIVSQFRR